MLCLKTTLASDVSECFISEVLQGWQNSHVPLFLFPSVSLDPCYAKSTEPVLWGALSWVRTEPQRPGALVCNVRPELGPVKSVRALPLTSNEVGLGLWKETWSFESFLSVQGRTQLNSFTNSLLLLMLFQQVLRQLKSTERWQSI